MLKVYWLTNSDNRNDGPELDIGRVTEILMVVPLKTSFFFCFCFFFCFFVFFFLLFSQSLFKVYYEMEECVHSMIDSKQVMLYLHCKIVIYFNHCQMILLSHFTGLCGLQSVNLSTISPFSLVDSNHDLDALQDCIWLFTASSSYRVVLRPILFIIHKANVFSIGHGHNPGNISSLILTRYKDSLPSNIISESTTLWMKTLDLEHFGQFAHYVFEVDQLSEVGMYYFNILFDNHYSYPPLTAHNWQK